MEKDAYKPIRTTTNRSNQQHRIPTTQFPRRKNQNPRIPKRKAENTPRNEGDRMKFKSPGKTNARNYKTPNPEKPNLEFPKSKIRNSKIQIFKIQNLKIRNQNGGTK